MSKPSVLVVGGGLAGALMATYLGQMGYGVKVFEKRPDPRVGPMIGGRSINLAISTRGLHALEVAGLKDEILKIAIPMPGRMVHSVSGELSFQRYGTSRQWINSIHRGLLNRTLLEAAARSNPKLEFHFQHRCVTVDLERAEAEFVNEATGQVVKVGADFIVGADGAFSAVRGRMQINDRFDYSQEYLRHGYKELHIPANPDGTHRLEKHALHIWPRGDLMMIALPNTDGSFTVTLFWPFEGEKSFAAVRTKEEIGRFFGALFGDAVPLMPTLVEDYLNNPTSSLVIVRCSPWHYKDKVVLVGDAAHAVVPFYGQGINAGFEDCVVLKECLERHGHDLGRAFAEYHALRKPHLDALAELCMENFIEMRDKVGTRRFRWWKWFEHQLHAWLPFWYHSLYEMVTFTRIPYAEAVRRAKAQYRVLYALGYAGLGAVVVGGMWVGWRLLTG